MSVGNQDYIEIPEGGLANLFTSDPDYDPHEGRVAELRGVAQLLAGHGRFEDTYMVHAAEGETVVPMEVFENNPALKQALWDQMESMGIEPDRYVVGSTLNSLNPVTGQPEFFLKKLFKGVKNAFKGVVKVFKKLAPVILPIALGFIPGVGPILAGALGSGIGTLVQGGNLKDALKAAAIGGAIGGISKGIGSFGKGAGAAAGAGGKAAENAAKAAAGGAKAAENAARAAATTAHAGSNVATSGIANVAGAAGGAGAAGLTEAAKEAASTALGHTSSGIGATAKSGIEALSTKGTAQSFGDTVKEFVTKGADGKGIVKNTVDLLNPFNKGPTPAELDKRTAELVADGFTKDKAYEMAVKELSPGVLKQWGPLAIAGTGALALAGGFKTPTLETPNPFASEQAEVDANPGKYTFADPVYGPSYPTPLSAPPQGMVNGGQSIFSKYIAPPAQYFSGGAVSGPGTETSDSIPALLSDGEFVLTAKAVRGAGGGSRVRGVKTLHDLMRNMEANA